MVYLSLPISRLFQSKHPPCPRQCLEAHPGPVQLPHNFRASGVKLKGVQMVVKLRRHELLPQVAYLLVAVFLHWLARLASESLHKIPGSLGVRAVSLVMMVVRTLDPLSVYHPNCKETYKTYTTCYLVLGIAQFNPCSAEPRYTLPLQTV